MQRKLEKRHAPVMHRLLPLLSDVRRGVPRATTAAQDYAWDTSHTTLSTRGARYDLSQVNHAQNASSSEQQPSDTFVTK